jgi:hypothetical protein
MFVSNGEVIEYMMYVLIDGSGEREILDQIVYITVPRILEDVYSARSLILCHASFESDVAACADIAQFAVLRCRSRHPLSTPPCSVDGREQDFSGYESSGCTLQLRAESCSGCEGDGHHDCTFAPQSSSPSYIALSL